MERVRNLTQHFQVLQRHADNVSSQIKANPYVNKGWKTVKPWLPTFLRWVICAYFLNHAYGQIKQAYFITGYHGTFDTPWFAFFYLPAGLATGARFRVPIFGTLLVILAFLEAGGIIGNQIYLWWFKSYGLYVNELMVKKLSMFACSAMILINDESFRGLLDPTALKTMEGLIGVSEEKKAEGGRKSIALLLVRLLISSLFLFVGWGEVTRQLYGYNMARDKRDGHNSMWPKLLQFLLVLPFSIGFLTKHVAAGLATVLTLEALLRWSWWSASDFGEPYLIHARDHFFVNVGVAAGLMLLRSHGAGKYSVDEYMKKTE